FGGIMPCADGHLQFTFHEEHQWRALVALMGDPAWASEPSCATLQDRLANGTAINARIAEWLANRTRARVAGGGRAPGVRVAPYLTPAEVLASPQFAARGYFVEVAHPELGTLRQPIGAHRFSGAPVRPGPAPRLGEHAAELRAEAAAGR